MRGSLWVSATEVAGAIVASLVGLVAARLLDPHDFGLVGSVLLITSLLESSTLLGFDRALVQRRGDVEALLPTAWTWQAARGLALTCGLFAAAPWIARWYGEPRLCRVVQVLAFAPFLRGLASPRVVILARALQFERQFALRAVQVLSSAALALGALFALRDYRALSVRLLGEAALATIASFWILPWRPRLAWHRENFRELWTYGRWFTATSAMVLLITRGDDLFVSRYFGLHALGVYQAAFLIANLPATHVAHLLAKAAFPVFAKLQDERLLLRQAFMGVLSPVLFVSCSSCALLLVGVQDLVQYVLGAHWRGVTPLVPLLALAGLMRSVAGTGGALYQALGRPELEFRQNLPRFLIMAVLGWPAATYLGLRGVCLVVLVALIPATLIWFLQVRDTIGLDLRSALALVGSPLLVAAILVAAVLAARRLLPSTPTGVLGAWCCALLVWLIGVVVADKLLNWRAVERFATLLRGAGVAPEA